MIALIELMLPVYLMNDEGYLLMSNYVEMYFQDNV